MGAGCSLPPRPDLFSGFTSTTHAPLAFTCRTTTRHGRGGAFPSRSGSDFLTFFAGWWSADACPGAMPGAVRFLTSVDSTAISPAVAVKPAATSASYASASVGKSGTVSAVLAALATSLPSDLTAFFARCFAVETGKHVSAGVRVPGGELS